MPRGTSNYRARNGAVSVHSARVVAPSKIAPESLAGRDDLPESVQGLYDEIVAALSTRGLTDYDLRMIEEFCSQIAIAELARRDVFQTGCTVPTLDGGCKANPSVKIQRDASTQALRIASEYGLTLAARLRLGVIASTGMTMVDALRAEVGLGPRAVTTSLQDMDRKLAELRREAKR